MPKPKKSKLIVGLPTRHEEATIYNALKSISEAIFYTQIQDYRLVVCINGCSDKTPKIVNDFIKDFPHINCTVIESQPGLVNAQRKIVELFPAEVHVFPDADGRIKKDAIKLLLDELNKDKKLMVVYAKTVSLIDKDGRLPLVRKMGILYDSQKMLTPRRYFHGRLFAVKKWYLPPDTEVLKRAQANKNSRELLKYCKKQPLLSADDILMSSYFIDKYGFASIKQVSRAHCYAWPIGSFVDWLNVYRRRNIEVEKIKRWYPEYNYLWPLIDRYTDWRKWRQADFFDKMLWLLYLLMKGIFFCYLQIEFLLLKLGFYEPPEQWKTTISTKKRFN
ncbi:MAG: glycosyltransferase family A protein [Candidatus Buchananbacteria bacterium]